MLDSIKKMITNKKDDLLDKPNFKDENDDFGSGRDDYHIPEPEDIRRLPNPGFQNPQENYNSIGRGETQMNYQQQPNSMNRVNINPPPQRQMVPPPMPEQPPMNNRMVQRPPPDNMQDQINRIFYRLDDIERRIARLEGYGPVPSPQPRRY